VAHFNNPIDFPGYCWLSQPDSPFRLPRSRSSVTITIDRYDHLMPGPEEEAASLLDAYLTRASDAIDAAHLAS
jgi:hypothetical protein